MSVVHAVVHNQTASAVGHVLATGAVFSTVFSWVWGQSLTILGATALVLSICWYAVTLWETETVKSWVARRRARRAQRLRDELARLEQK